MPLGGSLLFSGELVALLLLAESAGSAEEEEEEGSPFIINSCLMSCFAGLDDGSGGKDVDARHRTLMR